MNETYRSAIKLLLIEGVYSTRIRLVLETSLDSEVWLEANRSFFFCW